MAEEDDKPETGTGNGGAGGGAGGSGDDAAGLKTALASERTKAKNAEAARKAAETELASLKASIAAGKTDAERQAGEIAELREQMKQSNLRAMRAEVAAEKGLTAAQARRLQGDTMEALQADADELLAAFKPAEGQGAEGDANGGGQQQRPASAARPRENLRAGTQTSTTGDAPEYDSKAFLAALPRG